MNLDGSRELGGKLPRSKMAGCQARGFVKIVKVLLAFAAVALHHGSPSPFYNTEAFVSRTGLASRGNHESLLRPYRDAFYRPLLPSLPSTSDLKMEISKGGDCSFDISVDPLVARIFEEKEDGDNENREVLMESLRSIDSGILESSRGMVVWRRALAKGRSPIESDFDGMQQSVWPTTPLFPCLVGVVSTLQLPRLALRHPETIPMILRSILRRTMEYALRRMEENEKEEDRSLEIVEDQDDEVDDMDPYFYDFGDEYEDNTKEDSYLLSLLEFPADDNEIARDVAESLVDEWSEVVEGVSLLDDIFGFDHDFLSSGEEEEEDDGEDDGGTTGAAMGFGMRDGIWSHTGWRAIPALQKQIAGIPELNDLLQELGRRPSAEEDAGNRRKYEKFAPRKSHPEGGLGAEFDPFLRRESVTGIALSGNPSEMLPSEAVLLRQKLRIDDEGKTSSNVLRRLFLAKMAESKLQSYELSGWADVPSIPRPNPLYLNRMPSAPGGPIMVCLDTSWSMSGNREALSKAVVLACVSEAHKQGRDCQVVAFSTERKVMETGVITADSDGIRRLLEFLSHSFGGGTDVTGALKFAISALDGNKEEKPTTDGSTLTKKNSEDFAMEAADILLVTDGEIPDPPVPLEVMTSIERLKTLKGVKVHGLLVGKSESKPLSRLCTHIHDFLSRYTIPTTISTAGSNSQATSFNSIRQTGRLSATTLHAKRSYYDDDGDRSSRKGGKRKKGNQKWDRYDEEDEEELELGTDPLDEMVYNEADRDIEKFEDTQGPGEFHGISCVHCIL